MSSLFQSFIARHSAKGSARQRPPWKFALAVLTVLFHLPSSQARTLHVAPHELKGVSATAQFRSINDAAKSVEPGDTVSIHGGVYRESVVIATSGTKDKPIRFEAASAQSVIVTGADRLLGWQKADAASPDNIYSADWPHRFLTWSKTGTHPSNDYHAVIGRAEQVFVDGYPLLQVLKRDQMARGTFFVDLENKRLYVWTTNNEKLDGRPDWAPKVEASVRGTLWEVRGDYVTTRGLRFRYAANQAQSAAVQFKGRGDEILDCVFERMNTIGAAFLAPDQIVRNCTFQENGQLGFSAAHAHNLHFSESLVRNNNIKNFSRGWEAGGDKIVFTRGAILERSRFVENRGNGIWFDIGNEDNTVRQCLIADNEDAGIFYEISYGLKAHDNVILGNGLQSSPGAWGAAAGIAISSSPGCLIERNFLIGNKEGFAFREQKRTTPKIGDPKEMAEHPIWNHDTTVRNNVLAYNRDAQVWGWFDINDERHWPEKLQEKKPENTKAAQDIAREYGAKDDKGQPLNLSLEKLNLKFENNFYAVTDDQGLFHWGTSWKRHKKYATLDEVRAELNLEQGSVLEPFEFPDYLTRNFVIPAGSPAFRLRAYPRGPIPDVELGVLE
jgi:hypothetical protein